MVIIIENGTGSGTWKTKTGNIITTNEYQVSVNPVYQLLVFHLLKYNIAIKKCVACQRKSSLYDGVHFFCAKKERS